MNLQCDETCHECAMAAGGRIPPGHLSTVHNGTCPICLREGQSLTEPRDYEYPTFTEEFVARRRKEASDE